MNTICISSFCYTQVITCAKICIKRAWWLTKITTKLKCEPWDEIAAAIENWLCVLVEVMARYLSWLERRKKIYWSLAQIQLRATLYSYFYRFVSGQYHIYQLTTLHSCDYLCKSWIKTNTGTDERKNWNKICTLYKRLNWISSTNLTLTVRSTHGWVTQSIKVLVRTSVVVK